MTKTIFKSVLLLGTTIILFSFDNPKAWFNAGSKPKSYEMGIEKGAGKDGKNAATIKSIDENIDGFGTLMQKCNPDKFLGKQVKMTAYVKSKRVKGWAGLWLRIDQADSNQPLSFDNMHERPIKGTAKWEKYEIILDVPKNASMIAYGALLSGTGQIWFDNVTFEILGDIQPTIDAIIQENQKTHSKITVNDEAYEVRKKLNLQKEPTNLDFEE
jgi:hypothetical protein